MRTRDTEALPGIHTRLSDRQLLPRQHLLDGGYLSVSLLHRSLRDHEIELVGPARSGSNHRSWPHTPWPGSAHTSATRAPTGLPAPAAPPPAP